MTHSKPKPSPLPEPNRYHGTLEFELSIPQSATPYFDLEGNAVGFTLQSGSRVTFWPVAELQGQEDIEEMLGDSKLNALGFELDYGKRFLEELVHEGE